MAKIKISYTAPGADVFTADLDGTSISFSGTAKAGEADVNVSAGKHRVHYVVEGVPNTSYTVKIDPPGVSVTDTIGSTGTAAGSIPFTILAAAAAAASENKPAAKPAKEASKNAAKKKSPPRSTKKGARQ